MYVCLCKGITDSQIRLAVADGATSLRHVRDALGVSTECGKCRCDARQILQAALSHRQTSDLCYSVA